MPIYSDSVMQRSNYFSSFGGVFLTELVESPLVIDWQAHEEEWRQYLFEAFAETSELSGHRASSHLPTQDVPFGHVEFQPKGSSVRSRLWLVPGDEGLVHVLVVTDEPPTAADIEPWGHAVNEATRRLGSDWPQSAWVAAIGPFGPFGTDEDLAEPFWIGSYELESAGVRCFEAVDSGMPTLHGYGRMWTYPVVVRGTARGFNWASTTRQAMEELQLLCALISLDRSAPWGIKQAPQLDQDELSVPTHRPPLQPSEGEETTDDYSHTLFTLPPWLGLAWTILRDSEESRNILAIYYEGIRVKDQHPSLALVAYVAAIESIGAAYVPLEMCECGQAQVGATRRFRAALEKVMTPDSAKHLTQSYTSRSKTVHDGRLHGAEGTGSALARAGFFARDPGWEFQYLELGRIEDACQKLLKLKLSNDLPAADA